MPELASQMLQLQHTRPNHFGSRPSSSRRAQRPCWDCRVQGRPSDPTSSAVTESDWNASIITVSEPSTCHQYDSRLEDWALQDRVAREISKQMVCEAETICMTAAVRKNGWRPRSSTSSKRCTYKTSYGERPNSGNSERPGSTLPRPFSARSGRPVSARSGSAVSWWGCHSGASQNESVAIKREVAQAIMEETIEPVFGQMKQPSRPASVAASGEAPRSSVLSLGAESMEESLHSFFESNCAASTIGPMAPISEQVVNAMAAALPELRPETPPEASLRTPLPWKSSDFSSTNNTHVPLYNSGDTSKSTTPGGDRMWSSHKEVDQSPCKFDYGCRPKSAAVIKNMNKLEIDRPKSAEVGCLVGRLDLDPHLNAADVVSKLEFEPYTQYANMKTTDSKLECLDRSRVPSRPASRARYNRPTSAKSGFSTWSLDTAVTQTTTAGGKVNNLRVCHEVSKDLTVGLFESSFALNSAKRNGPRTNAF